MIKVAEKAVCECDYSQLDSSGMKALSFDLPSLLEAGEPPEARGLSRDQVRLMISHYRDDRLYHTNFRDMLRFLEAGDLLVGIASLYSTTGGFVERRSQAVQPGCNQAVPGDRTRRAAAVGGRRPSYPSCAL
jgi:hypothetical protein